MKKLYALALTAAITLSASAVTKTAQVDHSQFSKKLTVSEQLTKMGAIEGAVKLNGEQKVSNNSRKVRKAGETLPDVTGSYALIYDLYGDLACDITEIYPDFMGEDENSYTFYNMFGMQTDTPCRVQLTEFTIDEAGNKAKIPTLTFASGTVCFTMNNVPYSMYLGEADDQGISLYTNDLDFIIDEDGYMELPFEGCGIAFANLDLQRAYYIGEPAIDHTNGTYTCTYADQESQSWVEIEGEVLGMQYENDFLLFGFINAPYAIQFSLDPKTATARAVNQYAYSLQGVNGGQFDFYWAGFNEDGNGETALNAKYWNNNNKGYFKLTDYEWGTYSGDLYNGEPVGLYELGYGGDFEFDFTFEGIELGVENIAADNSNAPVEFFNLQGVRVLEPAAGNVYIRRQGTEVSKVIIK